MDYIGLSSKRFGLGEFLLGPSMGSYLLYRGEL